MKKVIHCSLLYFGLLTIIHTGIFAQQTRDPYKQPFAATSPWNTPIGKNAVYVPAGLDDVNSIHVDEDYIVLTPDAPITPILMSNAGWGPNEQDRCVASGGLMQQVPLPKHFVISPDNWDGRTPNAGLAVLLADGETIIQNQPFARCFPGEPGHTNYAFNQPVNLYGDGLYGAHGGSHLSAIGGAIRIGELVPGGEINHALKINVFGEKYLSYNQEHKGFRWPATTADGYASGNYKGVVDECRMGSLLALPADLDIESLGLQTEPAKILARTFQLYGAYIVDDTAWDVYALITEFSPDGRVKDEFQNVWGFSFNNDNKNHPWMQDLDTIIKRLHVVDNNFPESVGGGGSPIGPLALEFGRAGNKAPVVSLVSPQDYQPVYPGKNILVNAETSDPDGDIERVEFYAAGRLIGTTDTAPYEINWEVDNEGEIILLAKAIDNEGGVGLSQSVLLNSAPAENHLSYQTLYENNFNEPPYTNWEFSSEDHAVYESGTLRLLQDGVRRGHVEYMLGDSYIYTLDVNSEWANEAGILVHVQDLDNFYLIEITPKSGGKLTLKKCTGDIWSMATIAQVDYPFSEYTWYNVKVELNENMLSVSVGGQLLLEQVQLTSWTSGYPGVYSGWQPSGFDNMRITDIGQVVHPVVYKEAYSQNFNNGTANDWFFEREDFWEINNGVLETSYATHDSLVAWYQTMIFDEFEYEAKVLCEWNNRAGIAFHLQDVENFYILEIHPAWNEVVLVQYKDKKETRIEIAEFEISDWTWYNLKVKVENNKVSGWCNDVLVIDQIEIQDWTQGHIGVYQNECPSQFDDITLRTLSPTAIVPSQIAVGSNDAEKLNTIDGDPETFWISGNQLETAWIKLIMEEEILIESVSIDFEDEGSVTYPVSITINENDWQESTTSIVGETMVLLPHISGNTFLIELASENSEGENILAINKIIVKGYKLESSFGLPEIVITSPVAGIAEDDGSVISLTADVEPKDYTIQKVEWYLDGYKFITVDSAPYSAALTYLPVGNYTVRARLYTTTGMAIWADAVYLTVEHLTNHHPIVYMTTPESGSEYSPNTNIILHAQAFDPETALKDVSIYLDDVLLASYKTERYRYVWRPNQSGAYTVHAVAEDMDGAKTTSAPVTITITGGVSVDEIETGELLIFPNPVSQQDHLKIKLAERAENVTISLMDLTGRIVYQEASLGIDRIVVDMNKVKSGKGILILKVDIKNHAPIVRNIVVY